MKFVSGKVLILVDKKVNIKGEQKGHGESVAGAGENKYRN